MRSIAIVLTMLLCLAAVGRAETPPPAEPQLRIAAAMHTAPVYRIALSADGRLLASASVDKSVKLWSLPSGKLIRTFFMNSAPGYWGIAASIALSPDGRLVAVSGPDPEVVAGGAQRITLFDTLTGEIVARLGPLPDFAQDLAFSRDGQFLAAGFVQATGIAVWKAPFAGEPRRDPAYGADVLSIDFSPDGALASASLDGYVRRYEPKSLGSAGTLSPDVIALTDIVGRLAGVAFSPDGARLAVGQFQDAPPSILDARTLKHIVTLDTGPHRFTQLSIVAWTADGGQLLASGRFDGWQTYPILAWPADGRGQPTLIPVSANTVLDLQSWSKGGTAFSGHTPDIGLVRDNAQTVLYLGPVSPDYRANQMADVGVSADGGAVWFNPTLENGRRWLLDLTAQTLVTDAAMPAGFAVAGDPARHGVQGWRNTTSLQWKGKPLALDPGEISRTAVALPEGQGLIVGAEYGIHRYNSAGEQVWKQTMGAVCWSVNVSADGRILVVLLGDGTMRWLNVEDGSTLLTFFIHMPDRRWIAWTPSGYYAASPGGEDLIGWLVNGKSWEESAQLYPAAHFRQQYYRPDIVQRVLREGGEAAAVMAANALRGNRQKAQSILALLPAVLQPVDAAAEIRTADQRIVIPYRLITPSGRPVSRIEVLVDGRPAVTRSAMAIEEEPDPDRRFIEVSVPPRDSVVRLVPYTDEQPGVAADFTVRWTGKAASEDRPKLFALLIGISDYADPELRLTYAAKDAEDMAKALGAQVDRYYAAADITLLTNAEATEEAIETELARLRKRAKPDDIVVVFMAGHGVTSEDQDFYFLPTGASLAPDSLAATAIDGDIIRKGLSKIEGKVVLFIDACHSGAGISGGPGRVDMTGLANGMAEGARVVMFASSMGRQLAYEDAAWQNGAFTEALLGIFADEAAYGDDGRLSISELDELLTERVEALTQGRQTPVMTKPGAIKRFFLASIAARAIQPGPRSGAPAPQ